MTKAASINELNLSYLLRFFMFSTVEILGIIAGKITPQASINYTKN